MEQKEKKKKKPMSAKSRKAKGREFQKLVLQRLKEEFGFSDSEIFSRGMGQHGADIYFGGDAVKKFPFAIECKKQEKINIWKAIKQAEENKEDKKPIIIFSKNREKIYVVISFDDFIEIYKGRL